MICGFAGPKRAQLRYTWHMRANSVGKMCSEADLAYVAGLIDADGAIMACIEPHGEKKFHYRVRVVLKITQKREQDLVFLPTLFGCGLIRRNRTTYDWIVRDQASLAVILSQLSAYSRSKQQQLQSTRNSQYGNILTR